MKREEIVKKIVGIIAEWGPIDITKDTAGHDFPIFDFRGVANYTLIEKFSKDLVMVMTYIDEIPFGHDYYEYDDMPDHALGEMLLIAEDYDASMWHIANTRGDYDH